VSYQPAPIAAGTPIGATACAAAPAGAAQDMPASWKGALAFHWPRLPREVRAEIRRLDRRVRELSEQGAAARETALEERIAACARMQRYLVTVLRHMADLLADTCGDAAASSPGAARGRAVRTPPASVRGEPCAD
jgi:hypothetical protein